MVIDDETTVYHARDVEPNSPALSDLIKFSNNIIL
jgi:hypothetical protein